MRRVSAPLLLVAALLFMVPVHAAAEETALSQTCGMFIAHRGEHSQWTENTLRAMKAAAEVGADYVEVDVRETRDSNLVLMHDRFLDRTTRSSGRVADMTMKALRRVVLNDGTRVTSLRRNLVAVEGSALDVMLDIKAIRTDAGFSRLARQINAFGVDRVIVTSFRPRLLDAVHAVEPDVRRSLLTIDAPTIEQGLTYGSVSAHHSVISRDWLLAMRAAGLPVYAWTMNAKVEWARWNGRVTALTTDDAAGYATWRETASCPEITVTP